MSQASFVKKKEQNRTSALLHSSVFNKLKSSLLKTQRADDYKVLGENAVTPTSIHV